jgi:hypothetical protein
MIFPSRKKRGELVNKKQRTLFKSKGKHYEASRREITTKSHAK